MAKVSIKLKVEGLEAFNLVLRAAVATLNPSDLGHKLAALTLKSVLEKVASKSVFASEETELKLSDPEKVALIIALDNLDWIELGNYEAAVLLEIRNKIERQ